MWLFWALADIVTLPLEVVSKTTQKVWDSIDDLFN